MVGHRVAPLVRHKKLVFSAQKQPRPSSHTQTLIHTHFDDGSTQRRRSYSLQPPPPPNHLCPHCTGLCLQHLFRAPLFGFRSLHPVIAFDFALKSSSSWWTLPFALWTTLYAVVHTCVDIYHQQLGILNIKKAFEKWLCTIYKKLT